MTRNYMARLPDATAITAKLDGFGINIERSPERIMGIGYFGSRLAISSVIGRLPEITPARSDIAVLAMLGIPDRDIARYLARPTPNWCVR